MQLIFCFKKVSLFTSFLFFSVLDACFLCCRSYLPQHLYPLRTILWKIQHYKDIFCFNLVPQKTPRTHSSIFWGLNISSFDQQGLWLWSIGVWKSFLHILSDPTLTTASPSLPMLVPVHLIIDMQNKVAGNHLQKKNARLAYKGYQNVWKLNKIPTRPCTVIDEHIHELHQKHFLVGTECCFIRREELRRIFNEDAWRSNESWPRLWGFRVPADIIQIGHASYYDSASLPILLSNRARTPYPRFSALF